MSLCSGCFTAVNALFCFHGSHLDETDLLMPPLKKQANDIASAHDRPPTVKESERPGSGQKRQRSQIKEDKRSSKGKSADNGPAESKQDGGPETVPKAKRTRSDTDLSSASDSQHVDLPQATGVETKLKEGSLPSSGGGPVQQTTSASVPEVNRVAELDQVIASTQQEPAVVKKRMAVLLGPSSGKFLKTYSPARVYADIGCSERFSGRELYHSIGNVLRDELQVDASTVASVGGTGMEFAKSMREKQKENQSLHEPKLGAFTSVDDRRWRQKLAAGCSEVSSACGGRASLPLVSWSSQQASR